MPAVAAMVTAKMCILAAALFSMPMFVLSLQNGIIARQEKACYWDASIPRCFAAHEFVLKFPAPDKTFLGTWAYFKMILQWQVCKPLTTPESCTRQWGCWWQPSKSSNNCQRAAEDFLGLLTCPGTPAYDYFNCGAHHSQAGCQANSECMWRADLDNFKIWNWQGSRHPGEQCFPRVISGMDRSAWLKWQFSTLFKVGPSYYGTCPSVSYLQKLFQCPRSHSTAAACNSDAKCAWNSQYGGCWNADNFPDIVRLLNDNPLGQAIAAAYVGCNYYAKTQSECLGLTAGNLGQYGFPVSLLKN